MNREAGDTVLFLSRSLPPLGAVHRAARLFIEHRPVRFRMQAHGRVQKLRRVTHLARPLTAPDRPL